MFDCTASLCFLFLLLGALSQAAAAQETPAELSGFDQSETLSIEDGDELRASDSNLVRLLYRAAKTSDQNFARYSKLNRDVTLEQLNADPRGRRLHVIRMRGRAKSVKAILKSEVGGQQAPEIHPFCLVSFDAPSGEEFFVAVPAKRTSRGGFNVNVPRAWLKQSALDELAEFDGYFLAKFDARKLQGKANDSESRALPVFVANKIKWFPDKTNAALAIHQDHVLLAKHGVDLAQRDIAAKNNNRLMQADEGTYFYQMMRATRVVQQNEISEEAIGFQKLLQSPGASLGRAVQFSGRVRRVTKAQVTNPLQQRLLGADHYFVLDVFIPLTDSKVVVNTKQTLTGDEQSNDATSPPSITYDNRFPVTVCVANLPCDAKQLEKQNVDVSGFFFRLWNYPSAFVEQENAGGQVCPLVVGLTPVIVESGAEQGRAFLQQVLFGAAALLLLFGVLAIWYLKLSDRKVGSAMKKGDALPDKIGEIEL